MKGIKKLFKYILSPDESPESKPTVTSKWDRLVRAVDDIRNLENINIPLGERMDMTVYHRTTLQETIEFTDYCLNRITSLSKSDKYIEDIPEWFIYKSERKFNLDSYLIINNNYLEYDDIVSCIIQTVDTIKEELGKEHNANFIDYYVSKPSTLYDELYQILNTRLSRC